MGQQHQPPHPQSSKRLNLSSSKLLNPLSSKLLNPSSPELHQMLPLPICSSDGGHTYQAVQLQKRWQKTSSITSPNTDLPFRYQFQSEKLMILDRQVFQRPCQQQDWLCQNRFAYLNRNSAREATKMKFMLGIPFRNHPN